jgi:hypothetical protein
MDTKLFARKQPGGMFAVTDRSQFPSGSVFWVHATTGTDGAGYGQNPDAPFATLDYAIGKCTANKGDVIFLLPGHAENIASATGCAIDVAGVTIIGLGQGTLVPTLSITAAAGATIAISAANVWLENVKVVGNFLNIASAVTVTAGGLTVKNVKTRDTSIILGALIQWSIATGCADITFDGYDHVGVTGGLTAPATNVILAAGTYDRFTMKNSRIYCFTSAAAVSLSTGIGYDITLENIRLVQSETGAGLGIAVHNTSTGMVEDVTGVVLKNNVKCVTGTGLSVGARVMYSNAVNAYAGLFCYTVDA